MDLPLTSGEVDLVEWALNEMLRTNKLLKEKDKKEIEEILDKINNFY